MIDSHNFQQLAEREIHRERRAKSLVNAFLELSESDKCLYGSTLHLLEPEENLFQVLRGEIYSHSHTNPYRLILFRFGLDSGNPAWSSHLLDNSISFVLDNSKNGVVEFIESTESILLDFKVDLNPIVQNFLMDVFIRIKIKKDAIPNFSGIKMPILIESQAYFRALLLSLWPSISTDDVRSGIAEVLRNNSVLAEVSIPGLTIP